MLAAGACAACLARGGHATPPPRAALHPVPANAAVEGAAPDEAFAPSGGPLLLPASLQEARFWGPEPGGGRRAVVGGVRVVVRADGSLAAAADRLPGTPSSVLPIPERLGGGFIFVLGAQLWRSQTWLDECVPIFSAPTTIAEALVGLDRIYVRTASGSLAAVDARSGALRELGPLPPAPRFGPLVALDGWRALVVADMRGVLVTADAGASWRSVPLSLEPTAVIALENAFGIAARDSDGNERWWLVRPDGRSEALTEPPTTAAERSTQRAGGPRHDYRDDARHDYRDGESALPPSAGVPRIFDEHPLAAAIEDGWPLADGTAMIARDGALARVRIADGTVVELSAGAFSLSPASCHAVGLSTPRDPRAFGFVCGEPRGQTRVYAWNHAAAALEELRRFDDPRRVAASGNGALVVTGGCGLRAAGAGSGGDRQTWCIMSAARRWTEMRFRGELADRAQPIVLSDGRVALLRPPSHADLTTARLILAASPADEPRDEVVVRFASLDHDTERVLRLGTWLAGFEERRAGVLGGWVEGDGSVVGIEIEVGGQARAGEYIRDAGGPVVSGRWALGWTASRGGFESTDGGMTWTKELSLPAPLAEPRARTRRACGPIGCVAAGWLRIGWGGREKQSIAPPNPAGGAPGWGASRPLRLACEPRAPRPPTPTAGPADPVGARAAAIVRRRRGVTGGPSSDLPSFSSHAPPPMAAGDLGLSAEGSGGLDRSIRATPTVRIYAWGPNSGEWDTLGRWQVRWDWPWGGWTDTRASAVAPSPWPTLDAARRALGTGAGSSAISWAVVAGDDADHSLLVVRRGSVAELVVLEADRTPLPVQHDGEDAFPAPQSAVRAAGRWFVATPQPQTDPPATVLWALDGSTAREFLRIPRAGFHPDARLARRSDGHAIGLVSAGQPDLAKPASLWIAAVDIESAQVAQPESIGPPGITALPSRICGADEGAAWDLDFPYPGPIELSRDDRRSEELQTAVVRLRLSHDEACIESAFGSIDPYASNPSDVVGPAEPTSRDLTRRGLTATSPGIAVSVFSARTRFPLHCWAR